MILIFLDADVPRALACGVYSSHLTRFEKRIEKYMQRRIKYKGHRHPKMEMVSNLINDIFFLQLNFFTEGTVIIDWVLSSSF